jgi:hypothetical protein
MTAEKKRALVDHFLAVGARLDRAAHAGLAPSRLADLDHFRDTVQADLGAFLLGLVAPFEARRVALAPRALAELAVLETTPDLFGPLDHIREEVLHTRVLAWALSPARVGALGVEPLRAFLKVLADQPDNDVRPEWADAAAMVKARPEWNVPGCGRIDVWLELSEARFAIEAKVDAPEGDGQLERYRRAVDHHLGKRKGYTVFLALERDIAVSDPHAIRVTYVDLLRAWLPVAAAGRSGEHLYLGAWLRTLALHLVEVSGTGPFNTWPRARRGKTLSLLEDRT